jgi:hypothetical protein
MCPLTATDVLRIWELGESQDPVDQALTILAAACPELTTEQLADLSLGQRDRRLFILHQWLFGPDLRGFVQCPQCRERLEFTLGVPAIGDAEPVEAASEERVFSAAGFDLRFRLPNSRDLIAAAACPDSRQARQLLVQRCLQEARREEETALTGGELPEAVMAHLATRLAECDPWQEVLLDLACPACGHRWQPLLDIVTFLWAELAAQAKRLLREVHTLARAYGWREADILALSLRRRQSYLEMVGA